MRTIAQSVFWISFAVVFYVYIGYPVLLAVWRRLRTRPVRKAYRYPVVSVLIAAHNERDTIEEKIKNCLALAYPRARLEIVVALDGPTDGTDEVVRRYARQVNAVRLRRQRGKAAALNAAARRARGEILVFTDARQRLEPNAVRELVANFSDESIGAVSGELFLESRGADGSEGVGLYWRYEKWIRNMESDIDSVPGATGAIYATRKELYSPLPPGTILDDVVIPMRAVLAGRRSIFDRAARAYDRAFPPEVEYRRKVRTLYGNYQILMLMPELIVPWRNRIFAQYVSHKLGRLVVPVCLAALLASNILLVDRFFGIVLGGQITWYALAAAGSRLARRKERLESRLEKQPMAAWSKEEAA